MTQRLSGIGNFDRSIFDLTAPFRLGTAIRNDMLGAARVPEELSQTALNTLNNNFKIRDRENNFEDDLITSRSVSARNRLLSQGALDDYPEWKRLQDLEQENNITAATTKRDYNTVLGSIPELSPDPIEAGFQIMDAMESPTSNFSNQSKRFAKAELYKQVKPMIDEYKEIMDGIDIASESPAIVDDVNEDLRRSIGEDNLNRMVKYGLLPEGTYNPFDRNSRRAKAIQAGAIDPDVEVSSPDAIIDEQRSNEQVSQNDPTVKVEEAKAKVAEAKVKTEELKVRKVEIETAKLEAEAKKSGVDIPETVQINPNRFDLGEETSIPVIEDSIEDIIPQPLITPEINSLEEASAIGDAVESKLLTDVPLTEDDKTRLAKSIKYLQSLKDTDNSSEPTPVDIPKKLLPIEGSFD